MTKDEVELTTGAMPPNMAEQIRRIGLVIDPPATAAVYASVREKEPYRGVRVQRDLNYGPHTRHKLDVFLPERVVAPRPALIYVHGGGYVAGDKRENGSFYYDNVMLWAVRNGMVGVNMTYRLAPDFPWPAGAEDVASGVRWVRANIAAQGGNPDRIFLVGHSVGATHASSYAVMPQFHGREGHGLRGMVLISGTYDLSISEMNERVAAYFGTDQSKFYDRSPVGGLLKTNIPLMIAYAELEPPPLHEQSKRLVTALRQSRRAAQMIRLRHHNHISTVLSINTDDTELADAVLQFITAVD